MEVLLYIIKILKDFEFLGVGEVNKYLRVENSKAFINIKSKTLVEINYEDIILIDSVGYKNKLRARASRESAEIDLRKLNNFFNGIKNNIVRLNHVGISYFSDDFNLEVDNIKKEFKNSDFGLFYEESGNFDQKWYFIKSKYVWQAPMFEIVLNNSKMEIYKDWVPHFQIDIDTNFSFNELEKKCKEFRYEFGWILNVKGFGKLLGMMVLGSIKGVNICLGLGANNRDVEWHRKNVLKPINS